MEGGEAAASAQLLVTGRFELPLLLAQILVILVVSRLVGVALRRAADEPCVMVLMALTTTLMTAPIVERLTGPKPSGLSGRPRRQVG